MGQPKSRNPQKPSDLPAVSRAQSVLDKYASTWNSNQPQLSIPFINQLSELCTNEADSLEKTIALLDSVHLLDKYLWPLYSAETSNPAFVTLIATILNYKYAHLGFFFSDWSKGFNITDSSKANLTQFQLLLKSVYTILSQLASGSQQSASYSTSDIILRQILVKFITNCCHNIDIDIIRVMLLEIVNIGIWSNVTNKQTRRYLFETNPILKKIWKIYEKKSKSQENSSDIAIASSLLYNLSIDFINILYTTDPNEADPDKILYLEIFIELLVSFLSQLPTRRFLNLFVRDMHILSLIECSPVPLNSQNPGFSQIVESLNLFETFFVDDFTGKALTDSEMESIYYKKMQKFQAKLFTHFKDVSIIQELALMNISKLSDRALLKQTLSKLQDSQIFEMYSLLFEQKLSFPPISLKFSAEWQRNFALTLLVRSFSIPKSQLKDILSLPIYPDESQIFGSTMTDSSLSGDRSYGNFLKPLALPKLNLHFLTLYDYLLRNFKLYRLESTFQIKLDIDDSISRMNPQVISDYAGFDHETPEIAFSGWSRMATTIEESSITEIGIPLVGEHYPASVRALVRIDLDQFTPQIRKEWSLSIRPLDVLFLIWARPSAELDGEISKKSCDFIVRGCQVESLIGHDGKKIEDYEQMFMNDDKGFVPKISSLHVLIDPVQYKIDLDSGHGHIYTSFNLLIRRKSKENNFKSVLSSIIDLMQSSHTIPPWLYNTFLGFGDPNNSSSKNPNNRLQGFIEMHDTFIDISHLKESFTGYKLDSIDTKDVNTLFPPFSINLNLPLSNDTKLITVRGQKSPKNNDNLDFLNHINRIKFTPTQVDAILSAQNNGLTLIVGPPGSGKTDVAVQIISNLYHSFPSQKTLLITHSNQALNQLFEKILYLDIDQRHLLRLGHGEENLLSSESFSKSGRVDSFLDRRTELLERVDSLAKSLNIPGDVGYTCETAGYFFISQILTRWNRFLGNMELETMKKQIFSKADFIEKFPFASFFQGYYESFSEPELSYQEFMERTQSFYSSIESIFDELDTIRPFELLRSYRDRSNYLLLNEARIIAMTCTHAAMKRGDFTKLGFTYDNIIIEESAQLLEIESFIPLSLHSSSAQSKLKRVIMIGDHHQLPPVVKNATLKSYCNMEQSMFTRFVRLGAPAITLDMQGRSRPEIANLYRWCYPSLGDLPHTKSSTEFVTGNAGFAYNYQMINVEPVDGRGETEPSRYFYQNLAEAEYAVAIFQYMRLIGYPIEKIAILTTYNGQKDLILDILSFRCKSNPLFGLPTVSTVDQFQGMQKDYIILSLVRTKSVGHIRDLRRLIVCLSRARLGLYILCRSNLFLQSPDIRHAFDILDKNPKQLSILMNESYPTNRSGSVEIEIGAPKVKSFENLDKFGDYVYNMSISTTSNQDKQISFDDDIGQT